jgi:hypothetical protein
MRFAQGSEESAWEERAGAEKRGVGECGGERDRRRIDAGGGREGGWIACEGAGRWDRTPSGKARNDGNSVVPPGPIERVSTTGIYAKRSAFSR